MIRSSPTGGFVLVPALLIGALLLVLAVGLLTLLRIDLRRGGADRDRAEAKANAQLALATAIEQLQVYAGPDQATTGTADLEDEDSPNAHWTGVWHTTDEARTAGSLPAYLVSGNEAFTLTETTTSYPAGYHDAATALVPGEDTVTLVDRSTTGAPATADAPDPRVLVPKVTTIDPDTSETTGHYAYWVGDEGVKAKVNLADPYLEENADGGADEADRRLSFLSAQRTGTEAVLTHIDPVDDRLPAVSTLLEAGLLEAEGATTPGDLGTIREHFHDLTTWSQGLLTNTRDGGLRRDLTMAFEDEEIFRREFGGRETGVATWPNGWSQSAEDDMYAIEDFEAFYLVPEIYEAAVSHHATLGLHSGGPNWGILREYYRHKDWTKGYPTMPHPGTAARMRLHHWNAYKHGAFGSQRDFYHRNSPAAPVVSRMQMNLRIRATEVGDTHPGMYYLDLEVQPVLGLWNPNSVPLVPTRYGFDWEVSASLRFSVGGTSYDYDIYRLVGNAEWLRLNTPTTNFEPGEIRLFTADTRQALNRTMNLVPRWSEDGCFFKRLSADGTRNGAPLMVSGAETVTVEEVALLAARWEEGKPGFERHNTFLTMKFAGRELNKTLSCCRLSNLWQADDTAGPKVLVAGKVPPFRPADQTDDPARLAAWAYTLRTTREPGLGRRNLIDHNVRAYLANSRWEGSVAGRGWNAMGWLGDGIDNALLPAGNETPEADPDRYRGFGGPSIGASGETHLISFDIPTEPLVSLGQLQHAALGRYSHDPSYVFGNSYHNVRIPLGATEQRDFANHDSGGAYTETGLDVFDLSYRCNEALWDSSFFSTLDPDLTDDELDDLRDRSEHLRNSRLRLHDPTGALSATDLTSNSDDEAYDSIGGRLLLDGAFNVNSTSTAAWRAVLSSVADLEVPVYDEEGEETEWLKAEGKVVFSRLGHPFDEGFEVGDASKADSFWRGYRELSEDQIESIAEEIVEQVRLRGPFRSLSDFVNRSLVDHDPDTDPLRDTRLAGPLQMALDRAAGGNAALGAALTAPVAEIPDTGAHGWAFSDVAGDGQQATGSNGYLLQGDLLQSLGPILTARSDTFRIRSYGDKIDRAGNLRARAWCEAIVQRLPDPVEKLSATSSAVQDLIQDPAEVETNYPSVGGRPYFGRKFRIVSFRWLKESDL